jgi:hypothetical protein
LIATVMAAVFVFLAARWQTLRQHTVAWGLIYGFGLYLVMTYVVAPLSATHESQNFVAGAQDLSDRLRVSFSSIRPRDRWQLVGTLFTHMVFVGLPIAVINKWRTPRTI